MNHLSKNKIWILTCLLMLVIIQYGQTQTYISADCAIGTADLTTFSANNSPAGTVMTFHTALPVTTANRVTNPAAVGPDTYYISFYHTGDDCYAPAATVVVTTPLCIENRCPATTANLTTALSTNNAPSGSSLTWHSGLPVTTANRVANPAAVGTGNYYAAFYNASDNCYSGEGLAAREAIVNITSCMQAENTPAACSDGIDNDGDGLVDNADEDCNNMVVCGECTISEVSTISPVFYRSKEHFALNGRWLRYSDGGLRLSRGVGSELLVTGQLVDEATFGTSPGVPCGADGGWTVNLVLSNHTNTWLGNVQNDNGCNRLAWEYWRNISGTMTGTGCNAGKTLIVTGSEPGYAIQVGERMGTLCSRSMMQGWIRYLEDGVEKKADIVFGIDFNCYQDLVNNSPADCNENTPTACSDGIDNDGDGLSDCLDPDCQALGATVCSENTPTACTDGIDNDGDGLPDCLDPDCQALGATVCPENTIALCTDGIDNDGDGLPDCLDPDCQALGAIACPENTIALCTDGIDNDGDGLPDCLDPDCQALGANTCPENTIALCTDGIDNDGDGLPDCLDPDCQALGATACPENTIALCTDGIDNDGDGLPDCLDPDCQALGVTACPENTIALCTDGIDNDGDGLPDCLDPDCQALGATACPENTIALCTDGIDNDGDGLPDCLDPDCQALGANTCPENTIALCTDGIDNDGDGLPDCLDPDCQALGVTACPENTIALCTDGIDNDGDGLPDCLDPDCQALGTTACPENTIALCTDGIDNDGDGLPDCLDPDCQALGANTCPENTIILCNDGIDNDGDGLPDCQDPDCLALTGACTENTPALCSDGIDNDGDGLIDCADGDCAGLGNITAQDDDFSTCPGLPIQGYLGGNDIINGRVVYTLQTPSPNGLAIVEPDGSFSFAAFSADCSMEQFTYEVCDALTNCCASATVNIHFSDNQIPTLINIPDDVSIHCDEVVPTAALVSAFDNCPELEVELREENTRGEDGCALYNYEITRIWTASDICGNQTIDSQKLIIQDITTPDIFRIYTLPNGKRLVAGVMENMTHRWKTVSLPIDFPTTPLIFSQVISTEEASPVTTRIRGISPSQFEMKLQEEEGNDGLHSEEQVAWIALEAGVQLDGYQLEASNITVDHSWVNTLFSTPFDATPTIFSNMQSILDTDPATMRHRNASRTRVQLRVEEETSVNSNTSHQAENVALLAIENIGTITDEKGAVIGEVGNINIDDQWSTITTQNTYHNPVIIANCLSANNTTPATVRLRNVRANSFDIRVEEWEYADGVHPLETVSYMVIEGSVPLESSIICDIGTDNLTLGEDWVALDNCDINVSLNYSERDSASGAINYIIRTWSAMDECGNDISYSQVVECQGVALRVNAVLQGALLGSDEPGLMRDDLRKKGLIPLEEPYSDLPYFEHKGEGGGEKLDTSMLLIDGANGIVDWVFVELRDGENRNRVVATQAALIQCDGDIMDVNGSTELHFHNIPIGNYYVGFRHRNHLGSISSRPYVFTPAQIPFVDFTYAFTPVSGQFPNVEVDDTKALWSGDLNGDGRVILQGPANDRFDMFLQVITDSKNQNILTNFISEGYTSNDFNLDGEVVYQGPNNEQSSLLFNTTLRHPDNQNRLANYIIQVEDKTAESDANASSIEGGGNNSNIDIIPAISSPYFNVFSCYIGTVGELAQSARFGYEANNLISGIIQTNEINNNGILPLVLNLGQNSNIVWSENTYSTNINYVWKLRIDGKTKTANIRSSDKLITPHNQCPN